MVKHLYLIGKHCFTGDDRAVDVSGGYSFFSLSLFLFCKANRQTFIR